MRESFWESVNAWAGLWFDTMVHALWDASVGLALATCVFLLSTLLRVLGFAHGQRQTAAPAVAIFERTRSHQQRLYRIMTTPLNTRQSNAWSILLLVIIAAALLPNLRAAPPALRTAVGMREETADERPDDVRTDVRNIPARDAIDVAAKPPIVEQEHDVAKLLEQDIDPDHLVNLIECFVLVTSWDTVGGPGHIAINADTSTLRVKNVKSVQQATKRLIETFEAVLDRNKARGPRPPAPRSIEMFVEHENNQSEQIVSVYVIPSLLYADQRNPGFADFDTLIELITDTVDADTWNTVGGPGRIAAWPAGESLVVAATKPTHTEILKLCSLLGTFPTLTATEPLPSMRPVDADFQLGMPFAHLATDNLQTKLYPVHDLLPSQTLPVFRLSPRTHGFEQICDWIVTTATPANDDPICIKGFLSRGTIMLAAKEATHTKVIDALSAIRRQKEKAATPEQRKALADELFKPLYQRRDGYYPGSEKRVPFRVYLYGECDADKQLAASIGIADQIGEVLLISSDVTDDGMATVAQFKNLHDLTCWSEGITNAGVAHLRALRRLQLVLRGRQITDDAVEYLAAIESGGMGPLDISHTSITNQGFLDLLASNKQSLDVSHTNVTSAAVEEARKRFPNSFIIFNP